MQVKKSDGTVIGEGATTRQVCEAHKKNLEGADLTGTIYEGTKW